MSSIFPLNALENDLDFLLAISDLTLTNGQSMSYLTEKLFIPFELNDKDQASVLCDSDPDLHYYNSFNQLISKYDYFLESAFNENYKKLRSSGNVFSLCHMNIRGMSKNIHQFETYLDLLKHRFTVIGLTETWLKDSNCDLYGIKGYHLIEKHRKSQGGGVAVCIKDHLNYFERPDVSLFENDLESVFIEIDKEQLGLNKNVIVGTLQTRFFIMCSIEGFWEGYVQTTYSFFK